LEGRSRKVEMWEMMVEQGGTEALGEIKTSKIRRNYQVYLLPCSKYIRIHEPNYLYWSMSLVMCSIHAHPISSFGLIFVSGRRKDRFFPGKNISITSSSTLFFCRSCGVRVMAGQPHVTTPKNKFQAGLVCILCLKIC
jgi:hypothetical protein